MQHIIKLLFLLLLTGSFTVSCVFDDDSHVENEHYEECDTNAEHEEDTTHNDVQEEDTTHVDEHNDCPEEEHGDH